MATQAPGLQLGQSQSLVMSQQLQQSLKLLQMSVQELTGFIEETVEKNPLLEISDDEGRSEEVDTAPEKEPQEQISDTVDADMDAGFEALDIGVENVWNNCAEEDGSGNQNLISRKEYDASAIHIQGGGMGGDGDDRQEWLERTVTKNVTLKDYVQDHITLEFSDPVKRMVALHLADMLDGNGYLQAVGMSLEMDFEELCARLGCDMELIDEVIERLQNMDPPGIFARDMKECLCIQLRDKDRLDPQMAKFVSALDLYISGNIARLKRLCGVKSKDELGEMYQEILALNPRPGSSFADEVTSLAVPDVILRKDVSEDWRVELNHDALPRVLLDREYYALVRKGIRGRDEKKMLGEYYSEASWLVRSVAQRAETLLKVSTEIVARQRAFFDQGVYHLKPMILRDIAEEIGMHESTVGRVTANKYMATPRGVFELRYFFSTGLASNASLGEGDVSSNAVRHAIQELINEETVDTVLSDEALTQKLKEKGIQVARRTVMKYREGLGIASSVQRRRQYRLKQSA